MSPLAASHDSTPPVEKSASSARRLLACGSKTFELFQRMRAIGLLFRVDWAVLFVVQSAIFVREIQIACEGVTI